MVFSQKLFLDLLDAFAVNTDPVIMDQQCWLGPKSDVLLRHDSGDGWHRTIKQGLVVTYRVLLWSQTDSTRWILHGMLVRRYHALIVAAVSACTIRKAPTFCGGKY